SSVTAASPTFTPDLAGNYTFKVVATDTSQIVSPPAFTSLSVLTCGLVAPSIDFISVLAGAGVSDTFKVGPHTASDSNCLANGTFTYQWTLQPPPASSAILSNPQAVNPTFVADKEGSYQLSLTAPNSSGVTSTTAFKTITVACPSPAFSVATPSIVSSLPGDG